MIMTSHILLYFWSLERRRRILLFAVRTEMREWIRKNNEKRKRKEKPEIPAAHEGINHTKIKWEDSWSFLYLSLSLPTQSADRVIHTCFYTYHTKRIINFLNSLLLASWFESSHCVSSLHSSLLLLHTHQEPESLSSLSFFWTPAECPFIIWTQHTASVTFFSKNTFKKEEKTSWQQLLCVPFNFTCLLYGISIFLFGLPCHNDHEDDGGVCHENHPHITCT